MTTSSFGASRPSMPGGLRDDGRSVVEAGAVYVPVRGSDDHVHWAYEPKLRVNRIHLWCQHQSEFGRTGPAGAENSASEDLGDAPPCEDCARLAPLPTRKSES
ncbi:MAG TPA: hypothetical protein VFG15_06420 [Amycolatopsis sp.]|nr:hypothetical protein [Amycolatopsis sp.]